jgi:RNA polymerase sigma-70 factor (ECF subfamily)
MPPPGGATTARARSLVLRWRSDRHLVALGRRGDREACQVLVDRYRPRLVELTRQVVGSDEPLPDLLQDIVAAAHTAMVAARGSITPRPWLYRVTRDRALARPRPSAAAGPLRTNRGGTAGRQVFEDVGRLPEVQRTALYLRGTEGLSYEDAAEAMGTSVRSVQEHLVHARIALARAAVERGSERPAPAARTHRWRRTDDARASVAPAPRRER